MRCLLELWMCAIEDFVMAIRDGRLTPARFGSRKVWYELRGSRKA